MTTQTALWRPAKPGETPGQLSPECALGYHEACTDPGCTHPIHLPDRDDVVWSAEDEDAAWLWDDRRQERRADV